MNWEYDIAFDFCMHLHAMTDSGADHIWGNAERHHVSGCECYAARDDKPCHRNGRCIIARNKHTWKLITKKDGIHPKPTGKVVE